MKSQTKQFYSENILLSLTGHLLIVALLITSVVLFVDDEKIVTPDRIQIMEIDLNNVKITGMDTKIVKEEPKPAPAPEPVAAPKDKNTDSFVDENTDTKPRETAVPDTKNDVKPVDAPKKKTVVRVNREVLSLDRTMSISVVDALRVAMTRCWTIDTRRPGLDDIRAVAHLKMRPNGTVADVWFESAARADNDPVFAYVLDTIRAAIRVCEPLSMLPRAEFSKWESIQLTFYPISGRVM